MSQFDDFKPPQPPRVVPFIFGLISGFIGAIFVMLFIGGTMVSLMNSSSGRFATIDWGAFLLILSLLALLAFMHVIFAESWPSKRFRALARVFGFRRLDADNRWPGKFLFLGLMAGCCVALLLQGLCFTAIGASG